ncbi:putative GTP-binding protein EngB OS=Rhodopseudomonas palustris (strain BisB18) GN=engB PE=3 SV=1 [Rhizoctonia solani AG-1 IB]|uniref:GTP-binding protein 8 n=1 Tax=Thanatephorus cucumeris (strain AG1-IB / isolate 7/3/14) TaxID=1108050 RepID=A0A0B7FW34_THACB|nr:putative GTP-binding protein EngB OS=Rhodopseudomonas palustris (strain BisB18) GN=engB PE=3 SV=1 [Rhizoctonia solani AG-1 IB]
MRISRICRKISPQIFDTPGVCKFITSSPTPESLPRESKAEIIFIGRANVGKSSLLNSVMGRNSLVLTSSKPGRTQALNFFQVGPNAGELTLVDAPGYGLRGRPEWGRVFEHYLEKRKSLRRIFLLVNAKHGFSEFDRVMLQDIDGRFKQAAGLSFSYQLVLTKIDEVKPQDTLRVRSQVEYEARKISGGFGSGVFVTSTKNNGFGINDLRHAITEACG